MVVIGIDCGTKTGFAVWDIEKSKITYMETLKIHEAILKILEMHKAGVIGLVRVEDARKSYGSKEKSQGAGSIKRDSAIWDAFLKDYKIPYQMVAPTRGSTYKATKAKPHKMHVFHRNFPKIPRLTTVTEDHIRDAVHLCYKVNRAFIKPFNSNLA